MLVLAGEGDITEVPGKEPGTSVDATRGGMSVPDIDDVEADMVEHSARVSISQAVTSNQQITAKRMLSCVNQSGRKLLSNVLAAAQVQWVIQGYCSLKRLRRVHTVEVIHNGFLLANVAI